MTYDEQLAIDHNLGIDMAYYSELASSAEPQALAPGSESEIQFNKFSDSQQHLNPVHLAWRNLASASEHAGYAEHMRYVTTGGVVPRPNATLARVPLLGAARVIYILAPDDPQERAVRAARIANVEFIDATRMIEKWESQDDPSGFIDDLRKYSKDLRVEAGAVLLAAGKNESSGINESELLKQAIKEIPDAPSDCVEQAITLWNRLSGVAHARSWTWNLHSGVVPRADFVGTWFIPVVTLCHAWRLWNLRRGKPDEPHQHPEDWYPDRLRWGPIRRECKLVSLVRRRILKLLVSGARFFSKWRRGSRQASH